MLHLVLPNYHCRMAAPRPITLYIIIICTPSWEYRRREEKNNNIPPKIKREYLTQFQIMFISFSIVNIFAVAACGCSVWRLEFGLATVKLGWRRGERGEEGISNGADFVAKLQFPSLPSLQMSIWTFCKRIFSSLSVLYQLESTLWRLSGLLSWRAPSSRLSWQLKSLEWQSNFWHFFSGSCPSA